MALLKLEGFDHVGSTSQLARKWTYAGGGVTTTGRFSGNGWLFNNVPSSSAYLSQDLVTTSDTFIFGGAISADYGDATNPVIVLQDETGATQIDIRITSGGAIQITRNGTVIGASASALFVFGFWNYLEFKVVINDTIGSFNIKLNGLVVLNSTGIDTRAQPGTLVKKLRLQPFTFAPTGNYNVKFDDIYFLDASGSFNNDFLGECRIQTNYPNADGSTTDFTPKTGIINYNQVNENPADDDSTYTVGSSPTEVDLFDVTDFSFTGSIFAVAVNSTMRKDDVGSRTVASVVRTSGTVYEGPETAALSDYKIAQAVFPLNPNTSAAWTLGQINASEFGLKIIS